jgi:hypothetical protein
MEAISNNQLQMYRAVADIKSTNWPDDSSFSAG